MSNFKDNRCPRCKIGYIYVTPEKETYVEHCTDCKYVNVRENLRCENRRVLADRRSIMRYIYSKIGVFLKG